MCLEENSPAEAEAQLLLPLFEATATETQRISGEGWRR